MCFESAAGTQRGLGFFQTTEPRNQGTGKWFKLSGLYDSQEITWRAARIYLLYILHALISLRSASMIISHSD